MYVFPEKIDTDNYDAINIFECLVKQWNKDSNINSWDKTAMNSRQWKIRIYQSNIIS